MFCDLFARYMPAISRPPSRPASRVSLVDRGLDRAADAMSRTTFSRVSADKGQRRDQGIKQASAVSPTSACISAPMTTT